MKFNKAAMFGLDARIALAIFGALSVISGAALYSAIQEARVTATIAELEEYGKAYYAYYLDTGEELPNWPSDLFDVESVPLITSSKPGWKGPYLGLKVSQGYNWSLTPTGQDGPNTYMRYMRTTMADYDSSVLAEVNATTCEKVANKGKCHAWVVARDYSEDIVKAIDERIDGGDGGTKGKIKFNGSGSIAIVYHIGVSNVGR